MINAACGQIGAIPVPANWHWRGEELRHVITHGSPMVLAERGAEIFPASPLVARPRLGRHHVDGTAGSRSSSIHRAVVRQHLRFAERTGVP